MRNPRLAPGDTNTLAPASDIGRIRLAMRAPPARRMIVPGPAGRRADLEADPAAQALTRGGLAGRNGFLFRFRERANHSRFLPRATAPVVDRISVHAACRKPGSRRPVEPTSRLYLPTPTPVRGWAGWA